MKFYDVTIIRTAFKTITIKADNETEAESMAWKEYQGDADDCVSNEIFDVVKSETTEV